MRVPLLPAIVASACLLLSLLAPSPVHAAEAAPAKAAARAEPLTLDEALRLADTRHESPKIARSLVDRARAFRREAFANLLPAVTLSAVYTRRANERLVQIPGTSETSYIQRYNALSGQAFVDVDLLNASAYPFIGAAESGLRAAELDAQQVRRTLSFDVADAFFSVLAAEQLEAAAKQRLDLAERTVTDAERRAEAGLASRGDVTRGDLERTAAKTSLLQARRSVRLARLSLSLLVATDVRGPLVDPAPIEAKGGEAEAFEARPDLKAQEARVEQARRLAIEPWLRVVPVIGLRAIGTATNEPGLGPATNGNLALTLTWALFDGGVRYAQAAARAAEVEAEALTTDLFRREIANEIRTANAEIEIATESIDAARTTVEAARRNLQDVELRRANGLASALEQADAAVASFQADAELVRQKLALRRSELLLLEALGRWPTTPPNGTRKEAP